MYPEELCAPMRKELVDVGFIELKNKLDVDDCLSSENETLLLFVNSVCGCAAGTERPAVIKSMQNLKKPKICVTVFAGQDTEATESARNYLLPYPPSSPCIILFKNNQIVHFIERHHIEGSDFETLYESLVSAFNEYC